MPYELTRRALLDRVPVGAMRSTSRPLSSLGFVPSIVTNDTSISARWRRWISDWTPWRTLDEATGAAIPTVPGLYRLGCAGFHGLAYIVALPAIGLRVLRAGAYVRAELIGGWPRSSGAGDLVLPGSFLDPELKTIDHGTGRRLPQRLRDAVREPAPVLSAQVRGVGGHEKHYWGATPVNRASNGVLSSRIVAAPPIGDLYLDEPWVSIRWDGVHQCVHTEST
ncbi:MAG TPA: hypothetical protein VGU71_06610 [Candidatus Dormibacteraeota bacterium]|nr:hypothetical protein [Candidatus Dormibacteraeota bacterium]